jgi:beta-galactosidase
VKRESVVWPTAGFSYGGDYSPEQWPEEVWEEDGRLMQEAGVNLVSVGIFTWGRIEPELGRYEFDWFDRALDILHAHGVAVNLATPTAAPPIWLHRQHPEMFPQDEWGHRLGQGARQAWCPSSPIFRDHAMRIVAAVAERYKGHPALRMWHVNNELGCHNARCYCDASAVAFRQWLHKRYGSLDILNSAWGTAFWSQQYSSWDDILPPRAAPSFANPTQMLDFYRFSSDELLDYYLAERRLLRLITPHVPISTNFMVLNDTNPVDYASWASEMDIVTNDHYYWSANLEPHYELAFSADRVRGMSSGEPWMLMEHSTSMVNWQPRNRAKPAGNLLRENLSHVARGADGLMFFQWRASKAGAEKYHSAMLPHGGTDTKIWRETAELGARLKDLGEVRGTVVPKADVVMLFDHQAWWASELRATPSSDGFRYVDRPRALHRALTDLGIAVDVLRPGTDISSYRAVLVPNLYLLSDETAAAINALVASGGHALITYFSGIADENDQIRSGGYPGAFRELLGINVEEFFPLLDGQQVELDNGWYADTWTELVRARNAQVLASYRTGEVAGGPAVTRNSFGAGTAWYVSARLDVAATAQLIDTFASTAGLVPVVATTPGVEVVRRTAEDRSYLFVVNHTAATAKVAASGVDLLTGDRHQGQTVVAAGSAVVLRED